MKTLAVPTHEEIQKIISGFYIYNDLSPFTSEHGLEKVKQFIEAKKETVIEKDMKRQVALLLLNDNEDIQAIIHKVFNQPQLHSWNPIVLPLIKAEQFYSNSKKTFFESERFSPQEESIIKAQLADWWPNDGKMRFTVGLGMLCYMVQAHPELIDKTMWRNRMKNAQVSSTEMALVEEVMKEI